MINIAKVYVLQDQLDLAIDWLARAINMDPKWRDAARTDPDFDSIRADSRFIALVGEAPRSENNATPQAVE